MPLDGTTFDQDDPILRTLVRADELLSDESRWVKCGAYVDIFDGRMCIYGALAGGSDGRASRIHTDSRFEPARLIARLLGRDEYCHNLTSWNDAPDTTFADVKDVLARAIATRRAELAETAR